jgi:single-stranded-DNA-specific exonuclease
MPDASPELPDPIIRERARRPEIHEALLAEGIADWLADVLARRLERPVTVAELYADELSALQDPVTIPSMDVAVDRIVRAIEEGERVVFACDHDMDGTASAAVLWTAFTRHFGVDPATLEVVTSHRLTEGYGLTAPVVARIRDLAPALVITADKGSSDGPRIAELAEAGIDVIVTDHHELGDDGPPAAALAVVNPLREDSGYDPAICGAAVAFLVMAKTRTALLRRGTRTAIASLADLLDYVAVATVADCVTLKPGKSPANRLFVRRGLEQLNQCRRPCWQVFCEDLHGPVDAETLGFRLAPAVAAAGRLDWAEAGFLFLAAGSRREAAHQWEILRNENTERRAIESALRKKAFEQAAKKNGQSLVLYFEDGHSGVHGITASRLVEAFGKPSALFAPRGAGARGDGASTDDRGPLASGSFRGVEGLHVREALADVASRNPGLLVGFGGHAGAAGATVRVPDVDRFSAEYEASVVRQLGKEPLRPVLEVDGELPQDLSLQEAADALDRLEPWGKDFPSPVFRGHFVVESVDRMGDGTHLRLALRYGASAVRAVWFGAVASATARLPVAPGRRVDLLYRVRNNWFRNRKRCQLQIVRCLEDGE